LAINTETEDLQDMLDNLRIEFKTLHGMAVEEKSRHVKFIQLLEGIKRPHILLAKNGKNILSIDTQSNFPEIVYIQQLNVKRIVNNLISNALKHTNKGKVSI